MLGLLQIWIPAHNRWVHADACENTLDAPLMYEHGWGKKLSYVLAISTEGIVDVTTRYTRRYMQKQTNTFFLSVIHISADGAPHTA